MTRRLAIATSFAVLGGSEFAAPVLIDVAAGESLVAVRDKVRAMSAAEKSQGVEIVLAHGEYFLPDGMELTAKDGGVVWRAAEPGKARIVGARRIPVAAFRKVTNPNVLARLPEEGRGKVYAADVSAYCPETVSELDDSFDGVPKPGPVAFIDRKLGRLAEWPNGGEWASFTNKVDIGTPVTNKQGLARWHGGAFVFSDSRAKRWDFSRGVWLNGYFCHDWACQSVKAESYGVENDTNDVLRLGGSTTYGVMRGTWGRKDRRFRAFNVFEELDAPGEWWLDRKSKILFIVPPGGKMSDDIDVRLAFSEKPLVRGDKLANVRFEGLSFAFCYVQLVRFCAEGVTFDGCRFEGTADDAVLIDKGGRNVFRNCEIVNCGKGGLQMSRQGDRRTLTRGDSLVEGCRIHDLGRCTPTHSAGIRITGCGITVRGNEIYDTPHMAISYYASNDMLIESNHIHHVVMETGDAGAIYTGRDWTTQGNVIRYNFIHDIGPGTTSREGCDSAVSGTNTMGLYFDDCGCGGEVYGNVFMNCPRGILVGGGRDNPVHDNVFINCRMGMSIDCRGILWKHWNVSGDGWELEDKAKKFDYTNGVWAARYPRLANIMNDHPREPLYNPVENNVFIDCGEILSIGDAFTVDRDGRAPGLGKRLAPIRGNTVIYTKGADKVPRQKFDPRIASGFRVLGGN